MQAAGPQNFNHGAIGRGEAEVDAEIVLGEVTTAARYLGDQAASGGVADDACPDGAAVGPDANGFDLDPVVIVGGLAAKELRKVIHAIDENVKITIVVEIADGHAAAGDLFQDTRTERGRDLRELTVTEITVGHFALPVAGFRAGLSHLRKNVAIAKENVRVRVVVEIEEGGAPAEKTRDAAKTRLEGLIIEDPFVDVAIEAGRVAGEVGFDDVEAAVTIVIGDGHAHARLGLAVGGVSGAGFNGDIREGAVVVVSVEC